MRKSFRVLSGAASALALIGVMGAVPAVANDNLAKGKKLSFDVKKGNCLACHMIPGGDQPGTIGPPLVGMKARFPDLKVLKAQIEDARDKNPHTMMPPFGPHGILTDEELNLIAQYVHSL